MRDKFDRHHQQAIANLLTTTTVATAAQRTGISERTLRRWLERADFQAAYRAAKRELLTSAINLMLHGVGQATRVLYDIINDAAQPSTARVSAARTVLSFVFRELRDDEIDTRLAAIERQLAESRESGDCYGRRPPAA